MVQKKQVSISDVAREAGVNPSTVSRVLNADSNTTISEATRKKVLDAVNKLGYKMNRAVSLMKRGLRDLAVVLCQKEPYSPEHSFSEMLPYLYTQLGHKGKYLVIHQYDHNEEKYLYNNLDNTTNSGILLVGHLSYPALIKMAAEIPTLRLAHDLGEPGIDTMLFDNYAIASDLFELCRKKGYKKMIGTSYSKSPMYLARENALREAASHYPEIKLNILYFKDTAEHSVTDTVRETISRIVKEKKQEILKNDCLFNFGGEGQTLYHSLIDAGINMPRDLGYIYFGPTSTVARKFFGPVSSIEADLSHHAQLVIDYFEKRGKGMNSSKNTLSHFIYEGNTF